MIAIIGLGIMGSRFARRLLDAGHSLRGFDVDAERNAEFEAMGGVATNSPADAVQGCEIAVLSLLTSEISREVCLGSGGIVESAQRPLLVLDATTGRPEDSVETATGLANVGIEYADMTVSGNAAVAEVGQLVVMLGGSEDAYSKARPVMEVIGRSHHHVGPVGAGARTKLIVNHVLAVNRAGLAEGLVAAELAGLDLARMLEVLRDGVAYSRAMDLWGDRMVAADHGRPNARLRQSHKDSRLIVEHAEAVGAPADHIRLVESTLDEGETNGLADLDNSSAIEVIRRRAGIGRIPEGDSE
ncbi:MAG: NAD(P)-dependent oxidoreductase [Acidimicrobiia bacterium]|nr:NAD(P)-dependent oxidoreductase [Acidimicrobiia bacterium]